MNIKLRNRSIKRFNLQLVLSVRFMSWINCTLYTPSHTPSTSLLCLVYIVHICVGGTSCHLICFGDASRHLVKGIQLKASQTCSPKFCRCTLDFRWSSGCIDGWRYLKASQTCSPMLRRSFGEASTRSKMLYSHTRESKYWKYCMTDPFKTIYYQETAYSEYFWQFQQNLKKNISLKSDGTNSIQEPFRFP